MTEKTTLLIVDDSRVSRMMIKSLVFNKHPDWELIEAGSGEEALEKVADTRIDHFSIDLNMPGISGLDLIEQLQQSYSSSSMVLMTANIQADIFKQAMALGASCIHKPVTEESVDSMLEIFNA